MATKKRAKQQTPAPEELTLQVEEELETNLDPHLQDIILSTNAGETLDPSLAMAADGEIIIDVIAKLKDSTQAVPGLTVVRTIGPIVTGTVAVSEIEAVRADPNVISIKRANKIYPSLRVSTPEIRVTAAQLRSGLPDVTQTIDGTGVVIGIVDFGCDFAHPNFLHADGTTRLLHLWDQNGIRTAISPPDFGYGREFSAAMINQALQSGDPYTELAYDPDIAGFPPPAHGTHVMDIAAGNGRAPNSGLGVAPNADLIFVQLAAVDVDSAESFGNSRRLLEAVDYIFAKASQLNKPAVVNLSLATYGGPHDGSTLAEQGFDELLKTKGRAIVIAAGNSFDDATHASGEIATGEERVLHWQIRSNDPSDNELEIWYDGANQLAVTLISPTGQRLGPVKVGTTTSIRQQSQLLGRIIHRQQDPNNGNNQIDILLNRALPAGVWQVILRNVGARPAHFHAWLERDDRGQARFAAEDDDPLYTLGSIACGQHTLVVGSYDARVPGKEISYFSSAGPTRDGRHKPEISAPGHEVIAARSRTQGITRMSGTSMAAPHVTGLAALLLQTAGTLTTAELRKLIMNHVRPTATGDWDERFGNGRIDCLAALQACLNTTSDLTNALAGAQPAPEHGALITPPIFTLSNGLLTEIATVATQLRSRIRMQIEVEPLTSS